MTPKQKHWLTVFISNLLLTPLFFMLIWNHVIVDRFPSLPALDYITTISLFVLKNFFFSTTMIGVTLFSNDPRKN